MCDLSAGREAIDAANQLDPRRESGEPLALVQGRRAEHWAEQLRAAPSDALRLAARAHHLRRWEVPRSSYPTGRSGYLRWRRDQKQRHARELLALLGEVGVDTATAQRAAQIVTKADLATDPEVQAFEDAVALVFVETQFGSTRASIADDDKMVAVIAKTFAKMSPAGRDIVNRFELDAEEAELVARARAADIL